MKKIIIVLSMLIATSSFAASTTEMSSKWSCTTNASSSNVESDKAADANMKNNQGSSVSSFAFASKNCRDCTKITCETHD